MATLIDQIDFLSRLQRTATARKAAFDRILAYLPHMQAEFGPRGLEFKVGSGGNDFTLLGRSYRLTLDDALGDSVHFTVILEYLDGMTATGLPNWRSINKIRADNVGNAFQDGKQTAFANFSQFQDAAWIILDMVISHIQGPIA